jgi:hypothetical protein
VAESPPYGLYPNCLKNTFTASTTIHHTQAPIIIPTSAINGSG